MFPAISATIITKNEEANIRAAIESVSWAAEVLVLDSGSTDKTRDVARAAGAQVVVQPWKGYGAQKNCAAERAAHDWIFSLDADERVSPELAEGISRVGESPEPPAFSVRRRNYFAGKPIRRWPWSWDLTIRLYDRRRARFSERAVHESLQFNGAAGQLRAVMEHHSYDGWEDMFLRHLRYARLGAEDAWSRDKHPRVGDLWVRPRVTFLRHWLGRGYLLGGARGVQLSAAAARMTWMKYLFLMELWERRDGQEP